jgi:hypothetical protein
LGARLKEEIPPGVGLVGRSMRDMAIWTKSLARRTLSRARSEWAFFLSSEIADLSDNRLHRASPLPATIRLLELPRRSNGETGIENP